MRNRRKGNHEQRRQQQRMWKRNESIPLDLKLKNNTFIQKKYILFLLTLESYPISLSSEL